MQYLSDIKVDDYPQSTTEEICKLLLAGFEASINSLNTQCEKEDYDTAYTIIRIAKGFLENGYIEEQIFSSHRFRVIGKDGILQYKTNDRKDANRTLDQLRLCWERR